MTDPFPESRERDDPDIVRHLIEVLRADRVRWAEIASLDGALIRRQPAVEEWSALECLGHAADTEWAVFAARTLAILEGEPQLRAYDPDAEGTKITSGTDPAELVARHAALRTRSLEVVGRVRGEDLDRTSRHSELGEVTLRELLHEWAAHEIMHLVQAERAVMQAFIPGSGPWRHYFADHDVELPRERPVG